MRQYLTRPVAGRIALTLTGIAAFGAPSSASANVYPDVPDFNLTEAIATYSSYATTSGSGIQYRWLDSPWKPTIITSASCYNNSTYGESYIPAGNTSYATIGTLPSGYCFNLRGRTAPGYGTMYYYDGRVNR